MIEYTDLTGGKVQMTFEKNQLGTDVKDILVIPYIKTGHWLMTENIVRGIEFPGGKIDPDETVEQAVVRELWEETGVHLNSEDKWTFLADYEFQDKKRGRVIKRAFLIEMATYEEAPLPEDYETSGVHLLTEAEYLQLETSSLSFYMKDAGMELLWNKAKEIIKH